MTTHTVTDAPGRAKAKAKKTPEQKAAEAAYMREYRKANRQRVNELKRARYQENAEKVRADALAYYQANKESIAERRKLQYYENPALHSERKKSWLARNPEKAAETSRAYRQANREAVAERQKRYREANKDLISAHMRNRRALARAAEGRHTANDVGRIFDSQKGLCAGCRSRLFKSGSKKYHVDHMVPLSKGGTNWPDNLQLLCPHCNLSKHAKDPIEWAKSQGRLL